MAGTQSESSGNNQNEDVPAKKKRLTLSFKAFRQLFSRRKRTKSKEEEGRNLKAKSTTDMVSHISDDDDSSQLSTNKNLSLSHDSVFNSEKPRDPNIEDLREATRSMEILPQSMFTSELTQAVRGRRGPDDEDEDEALPASPVTHITTTADVLQNGLKAPRDPTISQGSDQSLLSMGDSSGEELEEEFFESNWASKSGSKHNLASDQSSDNDTLDLDCVKSSASLNMMPMKSKIDVRPRNVRPSSKHHRPASTAPATGGVTRTTSPKPPPGAVQVLPVLKEPEKEEEAPEPEEPKPIVEEQKDENTDFRKVVLRKTSQKDVKDDKEKDVSSESKGVVLRSSSAAKQDPSKRSTVAISSTSELTAFGERKVKRSSLVDAKNWEDGKEEESKGSNVSEFAQAFNKFQRKTSVKSIEIQKDGEQSEESLKIEREEVKQVLTSPKKDSQNPTSGLKSDPKKEIKKEVKFDVQEKNPSKGEQEIKREPVNETKISATDNPSTKEQVNVKTEKTEASTAPNKPSPSHTEKTVTLVIEKPVYKLPLKKDKNEDKENEVSYKRSSPVLKNRARSQTLPEQPVSKDILDTKAEHESSPKPIKKASSQEENSMIRSKSPPSSTDQSPRRSSSVLIKPSSSVTRPEIKKLTIVDKSNDGGAEPAWFAMAKRKTQAHRGNDENGDNGNKNQKESANNAKKNEENKLTDSLEEIRASAKRQSKVLDMVNKWQH